LGAGLQAPFQDGIGDEIKMMRNLTFAIGLSALLATSAIAHDDSVIKKARQLGIAVGKTYTCLPEEDRAAAQSNFEEMFDMIHHVDGHELAFVFAVAIGYGSASDITEPDCTELPNLVHAVSAEMGLGSSK
jgi:hypothetical protein